MTGTNGISMRPEADVGGKDAREQLWFLMLATETIKCPFHVDFLGLWQAGLL